MNAVWWHALLVSWFALLGYAIVLRVKIRRLRDELRREIAARDESEQAWQEMDRYRASH
jgi:hypothetical protein